MHPKIGDLPGFLRFVAARFRDDRCVQTAASLTFTTLLALVPLVTIALALISAFPVFSQFTAQIKSFLLANMVPEASRRIITVYTQQFSENAARLTTLGVVFLGVAAMLLMHTIDQAFNTIWRVSRPRTVLRRLTVYWAALTVGPLLIGASLSLTSWLVSLSMGLAGQIPALGVVLLKVVPFLLTMLAFSLLFLTVPNRAVPRAHAFTGGAVAALAFELMKRGFGFYVAKFATYKLVYGAFASIPIFLLWLYLSWLTVLLGAVIAAALSDWDGAAHAGARLPGARFYGALRILQALYRASKSGATMALPGLKKHAHLGFDELEEILERMSEAHWVSRAAGGWALIRDPETVTVADVFRLFVFQPQADGDNLAGLGESIASLVSREMDVSLRTLFEEGKFQPGD